MTKKNLKYLITGSFAALLTLAICMNRFFLLILSIDGDDASTIAWSLLVLGACAVAGFIPFFLAKNDKSKRFFACLSTLADLAIAFTWIEAEVHDIHLNYSTYFGEYYLVNNYWGWDSPTIVFGLVCGILFVVTLFFAVFDERNESNAETELKKPDEKATPAALAATPAQKSDAYEKLLRLKELLDAGILSEEEFEEAKENYRKQL